LIKFIVPKEQIKDRSSHNILGFPGQPRLNSWQIWRLSP